MKKLSILTAIVTVLQILQACNGDSKHDAVAKADSLNAVKDTTKQLSIAVEKGDAAFIVDAANGGMTEIDLGKLALQKGVSKQVKNFGLMMVKDHSKINDMVKAIAVTKNISIPKAPGAKEQKIISKLTGKSGKDFDKAYIDDMIEDHQDDIKAFQTAAKKCLDPDVKSFAAKTIPILQEHLDAINAIKDSMK
ncbi:MAG: DUF4142 domain-containing protein [Bacteroidota bacterium]